MPLDRPSKRLTLFGGEGGWHSDDWTASDDRVRGGRSKSYLDCSDKLGRFHGTLDIETLGGAGFASQRTTHDDREWDLAEYAGIQISVAKDPERRYTFIVKDELLPRDPDSGREQATISWECDFDLPPQTKPGDTHDRDVFIPWSAFTPTYRGKPKKDVDPLNCKKIKRMSIMMRSFFGAQEGDFSLSMRSISALSETPSHAPLVHATQPIDVDALEKGAHPVLISNADQNHGDYVHALSTQAGSPVSRTVRILFYAAVSFLAVYCLAQKLLGERST